jgi:hypothetical protein
LRTEIDLAKSIYKKNIYTRKAPTSGCMELRLSCKTGEILSHDLRQAYGVRKFLYSFYA